MNIRIRNVKFRMQGDDLDLGARRAKVLGGERIDGVEGTGRIGVDEEDEGMHEEASIFRGMVGFGRFQKILELLI